MCIAVDALRNFKTQLCFPRQAVKQAWNEVLHLPCENSNNITDQALLLEFISHKFA